MKYIFIIIGIAIVALLISYFYEVRHFPGNKW